MANTVNRILWWSLVASLLVYVTMAFMVSVSPIPDAPVLPLFAAFAAVSFSVAVGTFLYRSRALVGPIQRGEIDVATPEGLQKAFQPFIINLVLSESVGIYGLVLVFLSGQSAYSIPFALAALALLYAHRPTAPDLISPLSGRGSGTRPPPIA